MKPCTFAGHACHFEAVVTVRIADVGDRPVCRTHLDWMTAQGMAFRVLEPNAYVPEWRQRGLAKDLTRSLA